MTPEPEDSGDDYAFYYSPNDPDQPVIGIVKAVSWVTGIDPDDLEPLYSVIDVEPLRDLFAPPESDFYRNQSNPTPADVNVQFRYQDCIVTVTADRIHVRRE